MSRIEPAVSSPGTRPLHDAPANASYHVMENG